jgi:hypothetical protein
VTKGVDFVSTQLIITSESGSAGVKIGIAGVKCGFLDWMEEGVDTASYSFSLEKRWRDVQWSTVSGS